MSLTFTIANSLSFAFGKFLLKKYFNDDGVNTVAETLADIGKTKIKDILGRKKAAREVESLADKVVADLMSRIDEEQKKRLDVNMDAIATELQKTLTVDVAAEFFVAGDLDPKRVLEEYRTRRSLPKGVLTLEEDLFYEQLLESSVHALVATAGNLPKFNERAVAESLKRLRDVEEIVEKVLQSNRQIERNVQRLAKAGDPQKFETEYRQAITANLDYIELFGVTIPRELRRFQLTQAFVTLNMQRERTHSKPKSAGPAASNEDEEGGELLSCESILERLQPGEGRLLIRGVAGSGKTTLMRWVAIQAAAIVDPAAWDSLQKTIVDMAIKHNMPWSRITVTSERSHISFDFAMHAEADSLDSTDFVPNSRPWREQVPFVVTLRHCRDGKLPEAKDFPALIGEGPQQPPPNWVRDILKQGRGLVLIDGVDEVPPDQRESVVVWIEQLTTHYPDSYFIVTTRPEAVPPDWLKHLGFREARVNPMSPTDVEQFVIRWHQAAQRSLDGVGMAIDLAEKRRHLQEQLEENDALKPLATYPLLCGLICALHLESSGTLPETQSALCDAMCDALIHRREREQKEFDLTPFPAPYRELTNDQKRTLIQDLAVYMVEEGRSALKLSEACERLAKRLAGFKDRTADDAPIVVRGLLERSGILREPVPDEVDFLHNTFKEFLAGDHFASERSVGKLLAHALDDDARSADWRRVTLFAVGSRRAPEGFVSTIIEKLLAETEAPTSQGRKRRSKTNVLTDPQRLRHLLALQCQIVADGKGVTPELKTRLQSLVKELFPPRTLSDAESLATLRDQAVPHLKRQKYKERYSANCIRALRLINTAAARRTLEAYLDVSSNAAIEELAQGVNPLRIRSISDALQGLVRFYENGTQLRLISAFKNPTVMAHLRPVSFEIRERISDLSPLKGCVYAENLDLAHTQVSDFSVLKEFTALTTLDLSGTQIVDLSPLKELTALTTLHLSSTQVADLSPLKELTALTTLDLSSTQVADLSPLKELTALTTLDLSRTQVVDLSPLKELTALTTLDLRGTQVVDLSPLKELTALTTLYLRGTQVVDLSPLKELTALTTLDLRGTQVVDLSPLKELTALTTLDLKSTQVVDLSPVQGISSLRTYR